MVLLAYVSKSSDLVSYISTNGISYTRDSVDEEQWLLENLTTASADYDADTEEEEESRVALPHQSDQRKRKREESDSDLEFEEPKNSFELDFLEDSAQNDAQADPERFSNGGLGFNMLTSYLILKINGRIMSCADNHAR